MQVVITFIIQPLVNVLQLIISVGEKGRGGDWGFITAVSTRSQRLCGQNNNKRKANLECMRRLATLVHLPELSDPLWDLASADAGMLLCMQLLLFDNCWACSQTLWPFTVSSEAVNCEHVMLPSAGTPTCCTQTAVHESRSNQRVDSAVDAWRWCLAWGISWALPSPIHCLISRFNFNPEIPDAGVKTRSLYLYDNIKS